MKTETQTTIDATLGDIALKHLAFKSGSLRTVGCAIVQVALANQVVWPDEVDLAAIPPEDHNCIGTAWRTLARVGILARTQQNRRSSARQHHGRTIFKYLLANRKLAQTFLKRNGEAQQAGERQQSLI